jgi:DNA-binding transcriptional ArsR family regulator
VPATQVVIFPFRLAKLQRVQLSFRRFENSRNVEHGLTGDGVSYRSPPVNEIKYRESRVCRLLGNLVVYQLVLFLESGGPLTPSKLAKIAGRSVQTVSGHLAKLRAADLVRYDTDGKQVRYWLKHKRDTSKLLKALETIVHPSSKLT